MDDSFAGTFYALERRRLEEHARVSATESLMEQLAGPWGRVPGVGGLVLHFSEVQAGHMAARRGVVLPPMVTVTRDGKQAER